MEREKAYRCACCGCDIIETYIRKKINGATRECSKHKGSVCIRCCDECPDGFLADYGVYRQFVCTYQSEESKLRDKAHSLEIASRLKSREAERLYSDNKPKLADRVLRESYSCALEAAGIRRSLGELPEGENTWKTSEASRQSS